MFLFSRTLLLLLISELLTFVWKISKHYIKIINYVKVTVTINFCVVTAFCANYIRTNEIGAKWKYQIVKY